MGGAVQAVGAGVSVGGGPRMAPRGDASCGYRGQVCGYHGLTSLMEARGQGGVPEGEVFLGSLSASFVMWGLL